MQIAISGAKGMNHKYKTKAQLINELVKAQQKIRELESSKSGFERNVRNLNANPDRDNSDLTGDADELIRTRARLLLL